MTEAMLGISGYAGAGKDTLADLLVEHFGFTKLAFATPIRKIAEVVDPVVGFMGDDPVRYSDAVEFHGYEEAKVMYPEVRQFLQRMGCEGGRGVLGEGVWVDAAMKEAEAHRRVVFADMRFENEARAVKAAGGKTIRIDRQGVGAVNGHPSESSLDRWPFDLYMHNNSAPEDMIDRMSQFFSRSFIKILRIT